MQDINYKICINEGGDRMSEERIEANDKKVESPENFVKDGYINLPASLGEASPLQSSGDYVRSHISRDYELLTVLYRENWIAKRIIDMPCEDMTREWYTLSTELNQNLIDKIRKVEAKHNVKGEITNALRWARLYGGSLALIVLKGQEDMLDEPLDYDMIMPGCFKGLLVLDMVTGITPSIELEKDMDDPDFGLPKYYDVVVDAYSGAMIRIHHSRVLRFIGRDLPPQEEILENYWGASELEHIFEELQKRNATSANIAQLVFQANTRVLKMADYGEVIGMGTNKQKKQVLDAIEAQNRLLTSFGVQIMGTEDNMESHPYSFSGISDVYESFMMDMAGAANIPATKLFGRSPQGMNATGESDMNNYYESIAQMQERSLRPALEKLLPVICMSIFGAIPNDMEIVFEPIATTTPEQRSNISGQFTSTVIEAYSAGLIGRKTALMELKELGKDIGAWTKISDETIEEADDEVDNGEMGMGGEMPPDGGKMPMMPGESQMPVEEGAEETQEPIENEPPEVQAKIEEARENSSGGGKVIPFKRKEKDIEPVNFDKPSQSKKVGSAKKISRFIGDLFHRKSGDENKNHDPENGRFAPNPGGSSEGGHNNPSEDEISKAVSSVVSSGYKHGIDKKGMDRHRNKENAQKAAEKQFQKEQKRYEKAVAQGKDIEPPVFQPKSYFDGVNADFIMKKSLDAIDKGLCKWYSKRGGENKAQVTFNKPIGFTVEYGTGNMVETNTVTVTYSRENGFHCYPDEKKKAV